MRQQDQAPSASEQLLRAIAGNSFLSLWSYASVFRDQGISKRKEGKEVVDLMVVFDNRIILFSDKSCRFPDSGDLDTDWARWYSRAVRGSAKQLAGAERWIRQFPRRLFLDKKCTRPLPIDLPDPMVARFHRVIVASDHTGLRRQRIGGSGSLIIRPGIVGDQHMRPRAAGGEPFSVGHVLPGFEYVHVLDEVSMRIVLRTLNTVTDFCDYLDKKEALVKSGALVGAAGEEDLLAVYLGRVGRDGRHDFGAPAGVSVAVQEGHWRRFEQSRERQAQLAANEISYFWDQVIERFTAETLAGTHEFTTSKSPADNERVYRLLARESRTRRRMLSEAILSRLRQAVDLKAEVAFRVVLPSAPGDPVYAFAFVRHEPEWTDNEYRDRRRAVINGYAMIAALRFPHIQYIVGLATEASLGEGRSEDLALLNTTEMTDELKAEAEELQRRTGWLRQPDISGVTVQEYPVGERPPARRFGRNEPCPCNSGKKFKKCCGKPI